MNNISSLELFREAKDAYLRGDIGRVKELGKEAGDRLEAKGYVMVNGFGRIHVDDVTWALKNNILIEKDGVMTLGVEIKTVLAEKKKGGGFQMHEKRVIDTSRVQEFFDRMKQREGREDAISQTVSSYEEKGL